eukprot:10371571-Alexandrium_andersonii.AAC.1
MHRHPRCGVSPGATTAIETTCTLKAPDSWPMYPVSNPPWPVQGVRGERRTPGLTITRAQR